MHVISTAWTAESQVVLQQSKCFTLFCRYIQADFNELLLVTHILQVSNPDRARPRLQSCQLAKLLHDLTIVLRFTIVLQRPEDLCDLTKRRKRLDSNCRTDANCALERRQSTHNGVSDD